MRKWQKLVCTNFKETTWTPTNNMQYQTMLWQQERPHGQKQYSRTCSQRPPWGRKSDHWSTGRCRGVILAVGACFSGQCRCGEVKIEVSVWAFRRDCCREVVASAGLTLVTISRNSKSVSSPLSFSPWIFFTQAIMHGSRIYTFLKNKFLVHTFVSRSNLFCLTTLHNWLKRHATFSSNQK